MSEKTISRRRLILQGVLIIAIIAVILTVGYLYFTHAFKPAPKMEVLAENRFSRTLHVVTDWDYAPFSYVEADGSYAGLDVELMNEIANRLEMNLDLKLMDWSAANEAIRNRDADIIMNMETDLITPESGLIATIPTTEKQYVVYGRDAVHSAIDLYGKRVASLHQIPQLELDVIYLPSYEAIFEGLKNGEYEYAVCPIQVGNSFLDQLELKNIRPSYAVAHVYGALALPADHTALCEQIDVILKHLSDEGFLNELDAKWVNHRYEYTSVSSVIEGHPGFATILLFGLLLMVVLALLYIMAQRRSASITASYTKQLQDNLEVIRSARVKAYMDELTGIRNKNAYKELEEELQVEIDHRTARPFAIVVCDVNGLKKVNDEQGHQAGDEYIRSACRLICQTYDHSPVFRVGGDEFVAVLWGQDYDNRADLLAQFRQTVLQNQESGRVIVAIGMADYRQDKKVATVFQRADQEMYENKYSLKGARK